MRGNRLNADARTVTVPGIVNLFQRRPNLISSLDIYRSLISFWFLRLERRHIAWLVCVRSSFARRICSRRSATRFVRSTCVNAKKKKKKNVATSFSTKFFCSRVSLGAGLMDFFFIFSKVWNESKLVPRLTVQKPRFVL